MMILLVINILILLLLVVYTDLSIRGSLCLAFSLLSTLLPMLFGFWLEKSLLHYVTKYILFHINFHTDDLEKNALIKPQQGVNR